MNRWDELFEKHPIHTTLEEMLELVDVEVDEIDEEELSERRRISKVITSYQSVLTQLDPELVPYNVIDGLNNNLKTNVHPQITAYNSNKNSQNLINANDQITKNITQLASLLSIAKKTAAEKPIKGLEKSLSTFAKAIDDEHERLKAEVDKISKTSTEQQKKLNELNTSVETKKTQVETLVSTWQEQFSNAQNKRDAAFAADQTVRTKTYGDWREKIETETKSSVDKLVAESKDRLETSQTDFDTEIKGYLESAEDIHSKILALHEIVAGDSVAAGYIQSANKENDHANFWRWAAIVFIILTATWTGISYFYVLPGNITGSLLWVKVIKAISVTLVLLTGAGYCARQSNSHRQNEKRTRWFALEIKAIDPFIASLNEEDQKALKNKLSDKLFGQTENHTEQNYGLGEDNNIKTIMDGVANIVKVEKG